MKLDYLAFAAHPDDVELAMGATMAMLAANGKKTGIIDLTRGEMGTRGTVEDRNSEAEKSAEILRLQVRNNLDLKDSLIQSDRNSQLKVIKCLRTYRPDIVFINAPDDRHPDHGNASQLVTDSIFFSGLSKIETYDEAGVQQQPWRPYHILHYMQDRNFEPSIIVDVSKYFDKRIESILAFKTQFNAMDENDGPATYISSPLFFDQIKAKASQLGHRIGVEYGEAFLYHKGPVPTNNFDFLEKLKRSR